MMNIICLNMLETEVIKKDIEETIADFRVCAGAEPLIDIFMSNSPTENLRAIGIPFWSRHRKEFVTDDLLIAKCFPDFDITLALRKRGFGLALLVAQGATEDLLSYHKDVLLNPPVWTTRPNEYQDIVRDNCPDCNARLLATISSFEWGRGGQNVTELRMNLFGTNLKAGSKESGFLLDILQQVQSQSSKVSPFIRNK